VASDVATDVVDFASLAAAGIADASKLTDPLTAAAAIVDLATRVKSFESLAGNVSEQVGEIHTTLVASGLLSRVTSFIEQHFRL
jgi:hypothetical protein